MQVKATTSGTLLISKTNDSWTSATTTISYSDQFTTDAADLVPTSVNPSANATSWFTAEATDANNGAKATGTNYTEVTGLSNNTTSKFLYQKDSKTYALHETFFVQSPTGELNNLGLKSVALTKNGTAHDDIEKAVCVRVEMKKVGDTTGIVYSTWANSGSTSIKYVTSTTATADGYVLRTQNSNLVKNASDSSVRTIATVSEATSYQIDVYIYVDGENSNCTATKAYEWAGVSIDLSFGADVSYGNETID